METARPSELTHVLKLLDDDNPAVRTAVKRKLASYGADLDSVLEEAGPECSSEVREQALALRAEFRRDEFLPRWKRWALEPSCPEKLEMGQCLLASYLEEEAQTPAMISDGLDRLSVEFQKQFPDGGFRHLAAFLFRSGLFRGSSEDYYAPDRSNLAAVLREGGGNPISLACVFMLVGRRAGLDVGGCNYPAHFLGRAVDSDGSLYLVDCFNEGRIFSSEELIAHHPLASREVHEVVELPASAELILARVLKNLEHAHTKLDQPEEAEFMAELRQHTLESDVV